MAFNNKEFQEYLNVLNEPSKHRDLLWDAWIEATTVAEEKFKSTNKPSAKRAKFVDIKELLNTSTSKQSTPMLEDYNKVLECLQIFYRSDHDVFQSMERIKKSISKRTCKEGSTGCMDFAKEINDEICSIIKSWNSGNKTMFLDEFALKHLPTMERIKKSISKMTCKEGGTGCMDFAKEINDVIRKSLNYRSLSDNYEDFVAYSESLCNDLADKIQKLVEEKFTPDNKERTKSLDRIERILKGVPWTGAICLKLEALMLVDQLRNN